MRPPLLLTLFLAACPAHAFAQALSPTPRVRTTNLQLAIGTAALDQDLVAFTVGEGGQGSGDLNGDGDSGDHVLHVYDFSTKTTRNTGAAVATLTYADIALDGRYVVFTCDEGAQGNTDLNGDGDANDSVAHLFDAATGNLTNLQLAATAIDIRGDLVAITVFEGPQGVTDANGDGDTSDRVLFVHDIASGVTTNSGLAMELAVVEDGFIGFDVPEDDQGFTDLNGDGDTSDFVVHVYTASTSTATNLGLAGGSAAFRTDRTLLGFPVGELGQGGTDLNGDGDTFDGAVVHVYDALTGITTNLGLDVLSNPLEVRGRRMALRVSENRQGNTDLNADGDTSDDVVHLFDASTGTMVNLGLAGESGVALDDELLAFRVREASQGGADLNGDGDSMDRVVHLYEPATGLVTNVGLASLAAPALDGRSIAITVRESDQGSTDLNGDGDTLDNVVHVYDSMTGTATNLALAGHDLVFEQGFLTFDVGEGFQGSADLNGDGDTFDEVVHVHHASTGFTTNLGLSTFFPTLLGPRGLAVTVSESGQGFIDLNGDGDDNDNVLHMASWR